MRGYVEESPEVIARRRLREAARRFAGFYLLHEFGGPDVNAAEMLLEKTALEYAETQGLVRKTSKPRVKKT